MASLFHSFILIFFHATPRARQVSMGFTILSLLSLSGCGTDEFDEPNLQVEPSLHEKSPKAVGEPSEAVEFSLANAASSRGFRPLAFGISYRDLEAQTGRYLVVYGGYLAQRSWVEGLAQAYLKAHSGSYQRVYAVQGPRESNYASQEIMNSSLVRSLEFAGDAVQSIQVVAHSSGLFVADEWLRMLSRSASLSAQNRNFQVELFNLDGGRLSSSAFNQVDIYHQVLARRTASDQSANAGVMRSESTRSRSAGKAGVLIELDASGAGCAAWAKWCLHSATVTTRPHNPYSYDLRRDYQEFSNSRQPALRLIQ